MLPSIFCGPERNKAGDSYLQRMLLWKYLFLSDTGWPPLLPLEGERTPWQSAQPWDKSHGEKLTLEWHTMRHEIILGTEHTKML